MIAGIDGCTGGWIVAARNNAQQEPICFRVPTIAHLLTTKPSIQHIGIDVPIGLLDYGARQCDELARKLLGPRRNSVFTAPIRPLFSASTQREASEIRRGIEGRGVTLQAFGIVRKVEEVDNLLRADAGLIVRIREVHPEVCFMHLNRGIPMRYAKKERAGREERVRLLMAVFGAQFERALVNRTRLMCKADDIVDAFVGLWTAERIARGEAVTIPPSPPLDAYGIPMGMVA